MNEEVEMAKTNPIYKEPLELELKRLHKDKEKGVVPHVILKLG